jgi:nitrite reductase/ring-hydroxylating ferredoxin subunit
VSEYATLARTDEVPPGSIYEAELDGRSLLIVNVDGEFHVIDALCTHLEGPLSQGELVGSELSCPWHNSGFDVRTGEPLRKPATVPIGTYEVRVEDGAIRVART